MKITMNKTILTVAVAILIAFSFTTVKNINYKVNTSTSKINWKGFKPTGSHYGTIKLSDGNFIVKNKIITGGLFTIDMNSIVDLDMPEDNEYNAKLVGHLKSDDFFGAKKYPYAKFVVTSTEKKGDKVLINGNLTIKEKTNPVSFLATVKIDGDQLVVKSDVFKIDRSKWDVKYKSKSFFSDLADNFIYDDMEMSIETKSKK